VVMMGGVSYLMVPMYRQICDALGITQSRVVSSANTQVDTSRKVTVEFVASRSSLPWQFEALERSVQLNPGALATVRYQVENTLDRPVTVNAIMNTAPAVAAQWIEKLECFCFTSQTLAAGEKRLMPVVFRVSAKAPRELDTVTVSYTLFEAPSQANGTSAGRP
jgi:cytochrome c oxidase assembly protein subunit 11